MPDVETIINPPGNSTSEPGDLLGDYWADFLIFRRDARLSHENGDALRARRYLRSSLFTFLNYLSGLANRWDKPVADLNDGRFPSEPIFDRLARLADRFQAQHPPKADIESLSDLAARCSKPRPADERALSKALSFVDVDASESRVAAWLDDFVKTTGLAIGSTAPSAAFEHPGSIESISGDDYRCFGALGDDPHPFQDPPGTWGETEESFDPNGREPE